ncbi:MAG TPA: substrate-binding domain-containing protein, partial [Bryobacteraceae bacterium]|nr:substrate-binding domain-containing protein [Bryobacteraceae bacterium]
MWAMLTRRTLLGSAVLAGCRRSRGTVIGMVPKGTSNSFWKTVHAGALSAIDGKGLTLEWNAPALETDSTRQMQIVESMLNRRVSGIILAPVDRKALVALVERAASSSIPVVIFDSAIDTPRIVSYVATDNREGGRMAARRMAEILGGRGKVAIVGFTIGSAATMEREDGFQEELRKFPGMQMVDLRYSNSDRAVAMNITENIMSAHPDLAGIFADNEGSSTGAAQAVKNRAARLKLVAFDTTPQLINDMKSGVVDSIVVQNPFRMGSESARVMLEHLDGRTVPSSIDSGARLITLADLDKPEIRQFLNPPIERYLGG